ncbi:hypothetical protein BDV93DRAFT_176846 [Ceratobasidium sp. AG-I]|nr:hypothetical protein BDV93DRAFT_176846 [Ceratobasidium sp. AG-I]
MEWRVHVARCARIKLLYQARRPTFAPPTPKLASNSLGEMDIVAIFAAFGRTQPFSKACLTSSLRKDGHSQIIPVQYLAIRVLYPTVEAPRLVLKQKKCSPTYVRTPQVRIARRRRANPVLVTRHPRRLESTGSTIVANAAKYPHVPNPPPLHTPRPWLPPAIHIRRVPPRRSSEAFAVPIRPLRAKRNMKRLSLVLLGRGVLLPRNLHSRPRPSQSKGEVGRGERARSLRISSQLSKNRRSRMSTAVATTTTTTTKR